MKILNLFFFFVLIMAPFLAKAQDAGQTSAQTPKKAEKLYVLSPQDKISVNVFREAELNVNQRIDGKGNINIPLLGNVAVAGLTLRDAEEMIEKKFVEEEYLRDPQVTIGVTDYAVKEISILGEISKSGILQFPNETSSMDIREVISRAGGFTSISKTNAIRITRKKSDGSEETYTVSMDDIESGKSKPFMILPNDMITIPQRIF